MPQTLQKALDNIIQSIDNQSFIKISLGSYKGSDSTLQKIIIKQIYLKKEPFLSFTYRHKTKDIVKNYPISEAISMIKNHLGVEDFRAFTLFTTKFDLHLNLSKNKEWVLLQQKPSILEVPTLEHDQAKNRKIGSFGKDYLKALNITDAQGNVFKNAQDKYRQINHFVELLSSMLADLPAKSLYKVVDMGAGKGYLTFALYDYLNNVLKKPAQVRGVEYRQDLVDLCNKIAQNVGFEQLIFEQGTIESFENQDINVLIALHACDTATDDAILKGIINQADLIVVAPCCHKQIRREIEKNKASNELDFMLKYGILLERQAEMVTDGIRALILEYFGYSTKVFEFISDAHTPKNVLVVGIKKQGVQVNQVAILQKIKSIKTFFGIDYHHLERMAGLEKLS